MAIAWRLYDHDKRAMECDPTLYEVMPENRSIGTAKMWALHLHVDQLKDVPEVLERIHVALAGAELVCTGEYGITDWEVWGEEPGEKDVDLYVYFRAERGAVAYQNGRFLAFVAGNGPIDFAVTTAGDWSMQVSRHLTV